MNYNRSTRKRVSKLIISKSKEFEKDFNNFKSRLNDLAETICSPENDDYQEREMLVDYLSLFKDTFNEIKYLNRYKREETNYIPNIERKYSIFEFFRRHNSDYIRKENARKENEANIQYAFDFMDVKNIDVKKYIPYWKKIMNSDYCGKNNDIPMVIKDCPKIWDVFYEFYPSMPKDVIKPNRLWKNKSRDMVITDQSYGVPELPSIKYFKKYIVSSKDQNENKLTIKEIKQELINFKNTFFENDDFTIYNFHNVKYVIKNEFDMVIDTKEYDFINDMKISRRYDSVQNTVRDGKIITYKDTANTYSKTFNYTKKQDHTAADDIVSQFENNKYYLLYNDNSFCMAKLYSKNANERILTIEVPVENSNVSSNPEEKPETTIEIVGYDYWASLNFKFFRRKGTEVLKIYNGDTYLKVKPILLFYLEALLNCLNKAKEAFDNFTLSVRSEEGDPKKNYNEFINNVNNYKKIIENMNPQETDTQEIRNNNREKIEKIVNTIINTICPWSEKREKTLLEGIDDRTIVEGMKSILTSRMDKTDGGLFSWYSQELIPVINEYSRINRKIDNEMYLFKSGIITKPDAGLDYTQNDNGGKKLENPTFIDVPNQLYKYYNRAGINTDFKAGDEVYILDNLNPEIKCKIISIKKWYALIGTEEDDSGNTNKKMGYVTRIILDKSIPANIYKYDSLRIVKKI